MLKYSSLIVQGKSLQKRAHLGHFTVMEKNPLQRTCSPNQLIRLILIGFDQKMCLVYMVS